MTTVQLKFPQKLGVHFWGMPEFEAMILSLLILGNEKLLRSQVSISLFW